MKKLKFIVLGFIICLSAAIIGLVLPRTENVKSASASVTNNAIFEYLSFSEYGQPLAADKFTSYGGKNYLITNNNVTISFDIINHPIRQLSLSNDSSFEIRKTVFTLSRVETSSNRFNPITYRGHVLYPSITNSILSLYDREDYTSLVLNLNNVSSNLAYLDENNYQLHIIDSLTYHGQENAELSFNTTATTGVIIAFERPAVNFNEDSAVIFETTKDGDSKIGQPAKNQEFETLSLELTNYKYTEYNPLYYKINYNGFEYIIKMYSQNGYFYAYYTDTYTDSSGRKHESTTNLATNQNSPVPVPTNSSHNFKITFTKTGRYELKIYDSTYEKGLENKNIKETSFFINSKNSSDFENIYMLGQKLDNNGNFAGYIYSETTQNSSVSLAIKNLNKLNAPLEEVVSKIELITTDYNEGTSHKTSTYTPNQIKNMINNAGDLVFPTFNNDADYRVLIYSTDTSKTPTEFRVTIALTAKTHYNANGVNETASTPYTSVRKYYTQNPNDTLPLTINVLGFNKPNLSLTNTATNTYYIDYALKQVAIEKISLTDNDNKEIAGLHLEFKGVGDITVTINRDGNIEERVLTPENRRISLTEYGKYTITMVDAMGTTTTSSYSYNKPLNVSTIILIVLSSVILVVVVVFLVLVRKRIKTR